MIIIDIFSKLDVKSIASCSLVCKRWYTLTNLNFIWKQLYAQQIGTLSLIVICLGIIIIMIMIMNTN
eukprot:Pgem_evm1s10976